MLRTVFRVVAISFALVIAGTETSIAGPPFITDDPEPVPYKHWEFYLGTQWSVGKFDADGTLPHIEINHGIAPDVQLHIIAPMELSHVRGATSYGYSDSEVGLKYRFVHETEDVPQIGIFPLFEIPTGQKSTGLGNGTAQMLFPLWLQKSWDDFTTYGGGGYWYNPGIGDKDWIYAGWEAQYDFSWHVTLGGELFFHTADSEDSKAGTGFNLGAILNFTRHEHIMFSIGHSLSGEETTTVYFAFQITT